MHAGPSADAGTAVLPACTGALEVAQGESVGDLRRFSALMLCNTYQRVCCAKQGCNYNCNERHDPSRDVYDATHRVHYNAPSTSCLLPFQFNTSLQSHFKICARHATLISPAAAIVLVSELQD